MCIRDRINRISKVLPLKFIEDAIGIGVAEGIQKSAAQTGLVFDRIDLPRKKKAMVFDFWTRQRHLISYQPDLYDYCSGVLAPFAGVQLAKFCFNLPDRLLRDRRIQKEALIRRFPQFAKLPGTFSNDCSPLIPSFRNRMENAVNRRVAFAKNMLGFRKPIQLDAAVGAVLRYGKKCFPYISEVIERGGRQDLSLIHI